MTVFGLHMRVCATCIGVLVVAGCDPVDMMVRDMDPARIRPTHDITVNGQAVQVIEPSPNEADLGATMWQVRVDGRFFPCDQPNDASCAEAARAAMSRMSSDY